jgi:serine/threonine-protein kinase
VQALSIVSRNGVAPYRGSKLARDSLARLLDVGTLVEGEVERDGDKLRVTLRLVDAGSGAEFQRTSFEQPAGSYLTLSDSLSQRAAMLLRERLGSEVRLREQRQRASSPEAWVLVQRAASLRRTADSLSRDDPAAAATALDRADSVLGAAIALDAKWPEPLIMRGAIASQRVRLVNRDPVQAAPYLQQGLGAVEEALTLDPQDADALFQRGDLRYWRYMLGLESDPAKAKQLLASAQSDLETAVKVNPLQAQAWASLSHLYNRSGSYTDVNLAARRAYEADAYLSNIDVIINRLFTSSFDLGQFTDAQHWCDEGARRFPDNYRFAMCRLRLLTTRALEPDVARAWRLRDSVVALAPESERAFRGLSAQMSVATVLARAAQPDSARQVIVRSRGNVELDAKRDLLYEEAVAQAALGDKDAAFRALKEYWAANPDRQQGMLESPGWEFQTLAADPRWTAAAR